MKDRTPTYPGRVRLTPVAGQENVYDLVMADEPVEEGTPLNKASLLTDATAAAFGLTDAATPSDVLNILKDAVLYRQGNMQTMGGTEVGAKLQVGSYTGTGASGPSNPNTLTFDFTPKMVLIQSPTTNYQPCIYFWGESTMGCMYIGSSSNTAIVLQATVSGNTVSWHYSDAYSYERQFNGGGKVYHYLAIA